MDPLTCVNPTVAGNVIVITVLPEESASVGVVTVPPPPEQAEPVARQIAPEPLTAEARAVATPVPRPVMPPTGTAVAAIVPEPVAASDDPLPTSIAAAVLVPLVRAENAGDAPLPQAEPLARQIAPVPETDAARAVATPVPSPLIPLSGADVAPMVPEPLTARVPPEPTTMAAVVFVPLVIALKALLPPPPQALPLARQIAPVPDTAAARAVATPVPRPVSPEIGRPRPLVSVILRGVP